MAIPIHQPGAVLVHSGCSHAPLSGLPKGRQRKGELTRNLAWQQFTQHSGGDGRQGHRERQRSYLHKTQWQECHVVGTEEGVEENFLDPAVEVCF